MTSQSVDRPQYKFPAAVPLFTLAFILYFPSPHRLNLNAVRVDLGLFLVDGCQLSCEYRCLETSQWFVSCRLSIHKGTRILDELKTAVMVVIKNIVVDGGT